LVQNEETLICAKDLFNISNVIGRKKVAQFFWTHSVVAAEITFKGRQYKQKKWFVKVNY